MKAAFVGKDQENESVKEQMCDRDKCCLKRHISSNTDQMMALELDNRGALYISGKNRT